MKRVTISAGAALFAASEVERLVKVVAAGGPDAKDAMVKLVEWAELSRKAAQFTYDEATKLI